jgi:hypothetical protein
MKRDLKKTENDSFKTSATSAGFVLLVIWISFENLNVLFCTFTWSQYSRLVDELFYKDLVDTFGEFLWTAAIFSTFVGVVIDLISSFLSKRGKKYEITVCVFLLAKSKLLLMKFPPIGTGN